jgi:hypothetical protein
MLYIFIFLLGPLSAILGGIGNVALQVYRTHSKIWRLRRLRHRQQSWEEVWFEITRRAIALPVMLLEMLDDVVLYLCTSFHTRLTSVPSIPRILMPPSHSFVVAADIQNDEHNLCVAVVSEHSSGSSLPS